jgi:DNA-binding beta-propeller fold protein YncE
VAVNSTDSDVYQVTDGGIVQFGSDGAGNLSLYSETATPGNSAPGAAALDPSGRYFYITGSAVSQFTIGAGGVPQVMTPATVTAGTGPAGIAFDLTGKFVYVSNLDGTVSQFSIGSAGGLKLLNPGSVPGNGAAMALVVVPVPLN